MREKLSEALSLAELRLSFDEEWKAKLIEKALAPDNQPLPRGLSIEMERIEKDLIFRVRCERTIRSLLTTLDDFLAMAILALKISDKVRP